MKLSKPTDTKDIIGNNPHSSIEHLTCAICCPEVMQPTGNLHHKISKLILSVAEHILDNPTPFDPTYNMLKVSIRLRLLNLNNYAHLGD
jgi:hypothetical protein